MARIGNREERIFDRIHGIDRITRESNSRLRVGNYGGPGKQTKATKNIPRSGECQWFHPDLVRESG